MRIKCLLFLFLFSISLFGANNDNDTVSGKKSSFVNLLSVTAGTDYVASSIDDDIRPEIPSDEKIYVNSALPLNFRYAFSFNDNKIPYYYPGGYQGISVGVLNLGALQNKGVRKATDNIGYPVLAYVFQGAPFYKIKENLSLNYEWNFGAAIGWKPYSEENKFFNLTVGSQVNAYLHLGLHLKWSLNPFISFIGGIGVSHFSNGNTSFPNPGINAFGLKLGIEYTLNPPADGFEHVLPNTLKKKKLEYDISIWGASRKRVYRGNEDPVLLPGHYACAGISFSPLVRLNTWWKAGGALDIQWDQSSDMKRNYIEGTTTEDIKFTRPSAWRQINIGISAHAELRMPIFAVNIGCGYNLIAPSENKGFYQNITLKTFLYKNFYLNVGYQLRNFYQQSSLMLGAGISI